MVEIKSKDVISLAQIAESGQCFRWIPQDNGYRIPFRGKMVFVRQENPHSFLLDCPEKDVPLWTDYFDMNTSYQKIGAKISAKKDPFLHAAICSFRGIRILRQDPWEMLITSVITQNRNIPAIKRSVELLSQKAGTRHRDASGNSFYAFPGPKQLDALSDRELAACALGYRAGYIRAVTREVVSGRFSLVKAKAMPDDTLLKELMALHGVGEKVASCVMLFGFHRTDAFPVDVWMKRILKEHYPAGYPLKKYAPFNGIYQQYMFAYYRFLQRK